MHTLYRKLSTIQDEEEERDEKDLDVDSDSEYVAVPLVGYQMREREGRLGWIWKVLGWTAIASPLLSATSSRTRTARGLYRLVPLTILFLIISTLLSHFFLPSPSSFLSHLKIPSSHHTRVGPRKYRDLYNKRGKGCTSTELLDSISRARIREDGKSRKEFDWTKDKNWQTTELDFSDFEFSFDLPNCPTPHIFTPEETCDLISSFGGIFLRGDSLVRHLAQSIFMLLKNSTDINRDNAKATHRPADCYGEKAFSNGPWCRVASVFRTDEFESVCGADVGVRYEQVWHLDTSDLKKREAEPPVGVEKYRSSNWKLNLDDPGLMAAGNFSSFVKGLPPQQQKYSPVYIGAFGIHYNWQTEITLHRHLLPFLTATRHQSPKPIALWSAYTAPGDNKPVQFAVTQGKEAVARYNKEVKDVLEEISPGDVKHGSWKVLDWFGITDGASSYDGTHYAFQVNSEKIFLLLNLLDVIWTEIDASGGGV